MPVTMKPTPEGVAWWATQSYTDRPGRGETPPRQSLDYKKVAATLDTLPPMLYNGIATGKHSRLSVNLGKTPPSSR